MPIINTNMFWNYIINESEAVIDRAKQLLSREDKDYQTGETTRGIYYQVISEFEIDFDKYTTLRFPAGLTKYLAEKLMVQVEDKPRDFGCITKEDIYKKANEIQVINPKYEIRDYQVDAVYSSLYRFGSLIHSTTGSGKGQPVSLEIPTPDGFKKMGELNVGDRVFGRNGKPTIITGVFPQGKQKIYEVEFTSGQKTICDENHLWTLKKRNTSDESAKTYSIKQLLNMKLFEETKTGSIRNIYCNLLYEPLEYKEKQFEIDPYILGVIIGDGSCNRKVIEIINPEDDIIENVKKHLPKEYFLNKTVYTTCPHYRIQMIEKKNGLSFFKKVEKLGLNKLSYEKFIPKEYLEGSIQQRISLLHGLMDTDGCCQRRSKHSSISFSTTSLQLAKDVQQLIFSLGGRCRLQKPDERYKTQSQHKHACYQVSIQTDFCPFSCKSKSDKWIPFKNNNYLKSITYKGEEETICIKVNALDELYITSDYVLTHNTSIMCLLVELLRDKKVLITNGNNFILQQIYDRLISFGETDISWNKTKDPDYTKRIIIINTSSSDVRLNEQNQDYINFLKTVQLWCIDECFSGDTEILTSSGWKRFDCLDGTEKFANYKVETREIYFTTGKLVKRFHNDKCIKMKTNRDAKVVLTPHHSQLYMHGNKIVKEPIEAIEMSPYNKFFCSGIGVGKKDYLTNVEKIVIAIQADGSCTHRKNGSKYEISLSKERKITKWLQLISDFKGKCVEYKSDFRLKNTRRKWAICLPKYTFYRAKKLYDCFNLEDFNYNSAREFINEIKQWDGWSSKNTIGYDSTDEKNVDFVSAVAFLGGYNVYKVRKVDNRSENFNDIYRLFITDKQLKSTESFKKEYIDYNDYVYCVQVPEHNIVVRNSGDKQYAFVSGNCSHFQSITNFEPIFYMDPDVIEHVVGYTATPFRDYKSPYSDPSDFTLIALLGEPAFKYEMKDTIADKNIAQPYSYFIRYKNTPNKLPPWLADNYFMQYRANITYNKNRNAAGFAMIKFLNEYNMKTLVSFNNIKPGQKLLKELTETGIKCLFICGNETIYEFKPNARGTLKLETRKGNVNDVKKALNNGYNVILASAVFDEGVDIEIFQAAILFSAGKSPIKILQVSGRASRKKQVNNVSFIIDFRDVGGHYIFENQYQKRKELMEDSGIKNIEDVHQFMDTIKQIGHK